MSKSTPRPFLARLRHPLASLRDSRGVALVEMAFITPIILLMGVAGIEMANLAVTTMRVSQAAMHIADNASRIGDTDDLTARKVYEGDINDLFIGVRLQAGDGIDLYENGRVILSSLEQNADGGQWIHWQRCMGKKNVDSDYGAQGEGETGTDFDGMGPDGDELTAASGEAVMYVEIEYDYQPLIDNGFTEAFLPTEPIRSEAAFYVRSSRDLTGTYQRSTPSTVYTCDKYEAI
ncbi:TadE/TadG family type IV pilus assembly protein [Parerythrobacter aestuarii]|uniref:TadE/TadG family type IV pilus assembly protein n=1 Tax=Parerythrobacter aestuarii TaxID=3020909 RepID=UPI0024DE7F61|nr:TadE/TadG family type IV pilus assembly protein [Parerythrobacter aestuarii]